MNRISKRSAVMLAALLAATCLHVIVAAAAPTAFQGIFKLSHEVRWGKAVLPAGEYLLRVEYSGPAALVTIGEAKTAKRLLSSSAWPQRTTRTGRRRVRC